MTDNARHPGTMGALTYRSSPRADLPARSFDDALSDAVESDDRLPAGGHEWDTFRPGSGGKHVPPARWPAGPGGLLWWQCDRCGSRFRDGADDPEGFPGCDEALVKNTMDE